MSVSFSGWTPATEPGARGTWSDEGDGLNLSNANACALAGLLGIKLETEDGLCGTMPLPEARRAVIRARSTFATRAPRFVRADERHGHHVVGGVVQLNTPRVCAFGIDEDYLADRLDRFEALLVACAAAGATHITWG